MDFVNAISKARFASARPQRIGLHHDDRLKVELLCMEAGQTFAVEAGQWTCYVVTGKAAVTAENETTELPTGHFAAGAPDEAYTIVNAGEQRLVCLLVGCAC